jgi:hypothetical protein
VVDEPDVRAIAQLVEMRLKDTERAGQRAGIQEQLKALQASSASRPAGPALTETKQQLDRMVAKRYDEANRLRGEVSRLERLGTGAMGLALAMAATLLAVAYGKASGTKENTAGLTPSSDAESGSSTETKRTGGRSPLLF